MSNCANTLWMPTAILCAKLVDLNAGFLTSLPFAKPFAIDLQHPCLRAVFQATSMRGRIVEDFAAAATV